MLRSLIVLLVCLLPIGAWSAPQYSYPAKTTPVAGDKVLIVDSQDSWRTKNVLFSAVWGGSIETSGTIQGRKVFNSYSASTVLTAANNNAAVVQFTVAGEATMWDCETANVGDFVMLWARDAEKIEVVPASGDHFNLFVGTALTANNELDMSATAGAKLTLICTVDDTWSVYSETSTCTDGGAAD